MRRWPMTSHRLGFSIIEILVVLGIIAVFFSLLLPAVQTARDASRRMQCSSNLHNIGLAIHAYGDVHGCLPPGTTNPLGGNNDVSGPYSQFVMLLPYLELGSFYDLVNFDLGVSNVANSTVRRTLISQLICPALTSGLDVVEGQAITAYCGNTGSGKWVKPDGVFVTEPVGVRFSDVTDGAQYTAAVSEWVARHSKPIPPNHLLFTISSGASDQDSFVQKCLSEAPNPIGGVLLGIDWMRGFPGTSWYNHQLEPNQVSCFAFGTAMQWSAYTAGSIHNGDGVNLLKVDGSVEWVRGSIDRSIWRAMGSRNGNEVF